MTLWIMNQTIPSQYRAEYCIDSDSKRWQGCFVFYLKNPFQNIVVIKKAVDE
jgi:hypothetical protein